MKLRILLPALLALSAPALAASNTRVVVYPVTGDTAPAIYDSIKKTSPKIAPNATFAFTVPYIKAAAKPRQAGGQCRYASFKTSTIFHITLPHLTVERKPHPLLAKQWDSFVKYLYDHEMWHRDNWVACLADFDAQAMTLSAKDCSALDKKREKLFLSIQKACVKKDEDFDFYFRKEVLKHPFVKAATAQQ